MARKMRDSGVEWIGEVPEGWEVRKAKSIIIANDGGVWGDDPTGENDTIVLRSTEQGLDGKLYIQKPAYRHLSDAERNRYLLKSDDLIITKSSGSRDHIGKTSLIDESVSNLKCCYSNFIQRIRVVGFPRYCWYLYNNYIVKLQFDYLCTTTTGLNNLNSGIIGNVVIPIPPLPEQRRIADYLDEKCAAIDGAVGELKRGIEDCKAWKKAIIFEAVTGKRRVGVFNAEKQSCREAEKMKPSGIPWIGAIPEGWNVNKGRFIYDIATGKKDVNAEAPDGQYMFFTCSKTAKRIATYSFDCEALLVAGNGEVGFTQYYKGKFDAYQRTYVISGFRGVAPLFLRYYMSGLLPLQAQYNSVGSVIEFIKLGDLKGFVVTLPSLPEQQVIADYLDEKCAAIDAMVAEKEALIADLEAYKKSLIFELVTGKREVA